MASLISHAALLTILLLLSLHEAQSDLTVEKNTNLSFYLHEFLSGPNATVLQVVTAPNATGFTFGAIEVVDDMLRETQDGNSKLIGRAQGIHAEVSKEDFAIATMLNLVFTEGKYNGSTLAVYGRVTLGTTIERAIVGGTGQFRLARGYLLATPIVSSATKYIYEFDVYVWHY